MVEGFGSRKDGLVDAYEAKKGVVEVHSPIQAVLHGHHVAVERRRGHRIIPRYHGGNAVGDVRGEVRLHTGANVIRRVETEMFNSHVEMQFDEIHELSALVEVERQWCDAQLQSRAVRNLTWVRNSVERKVHFGAVAVVEGETDFRGGTEPDTHGASDEERVVTVEKKFALLEVMGSLRNSDIFG